jgi:hypothetical protein
MYKRCRSRLRLRKRKNNPDHEPVGKEQWHALFMTLDTQVDNLDIKGFLLGKQCDVSHPLGRNCSGGDGVVTLLSNKQSAKAMGRHGAVCKVTSGTIFWEVGTREI